MRELCPLYSPKAVICSAQGNIRFVPKADIRTYLNQHAARSTRRILLPHYKTARQVYSRAHLDSFVFVKGEKDGSRDVIFVQSKREV
jgi:hypothetical protein